MSRHVVRPGECVASLAAKVGVSVDSIWQHPDNETLRERRTSPHMLCAGDEIEVPEPRARRTSVTKGSTNRYSGGISTVRLQLTIVDLPTSEEKVQRQHEAQDGTTRVQEPTVAPLEPGTPLAHAPYRLLAGADTREGTTDGQGLVDEPIDALLTHAVLLLYPDTPEERRLDLRIGYLDPPDEPSGAAQRLANLGFPCDVHTMSTAIEKYQVSRGLEPTGELEDATRQRIVEESNG